MCTAMDRCSLRGYGALERVKLVQGRRTKAWHSDATRPPMLGDERKGVEGGTVADVTRSEGRRANTQSEQTICKG
jgi:hypothetical protein